MERRMFYDTLLSNTMSYLMQYIAFAVSHNDLIRYINILA